MDHNITVYKRLLLRGYPEILRFARLRSTKLWWYNSLLTSHFSHTTQASTYHKPILWNVITSWTHLLIFSPTYVEVHYSLKGGSISNDICFLHLASCTNSKSGKLNKNELCDIAICDIPLQIAKSLLSQFEGSPP